MSFFSDRDHEARRKVTSIPVRPEAEQRAQAVRAARERLGDTLEQIKSSYVRGSRGVLFSFDHTPFVGPHRPKPDDVNYKFMVEELARLVTRETGLKCELDEDNDAIIARLHVSFS